MHPLRWLRTHDAGYWALRRALRTAVVMPALFALGSLVLRDAQLATFAAFGSFALLLLVDFTGPRRERAEGLIAVAVVGAVFVSLGTLVSAVAWLAAISMAVVGFVVLFAGVVSSVLASATTALLLSFVLPVATPAPLDQLPSRLLGWGLASLVAVLAATLLWPAPPRDPLRSRAVECCRLISDRLRADLDCRRGAESDPAVRIAAAERASAATTELRTAFYATPNRPTGLGTASRTAIRLVDELDWLIAILDASPAAAAPRHDRPEPGLLAVKEAAAEVLSHGADVLGGDGSAGAELDRALVRLRGALGHLESFATIELPVQTGCADGMDVELLDALEPTFRVQELAFAVLSIGANIARTGWAERRTWWQRLLGHQPDGVGSARSAARERAAAHLDRHSVWLHNSIRGAIGLAVAVLVADLSGVQHSFWVVLGTLSVLRSNALSTGQTVARGLAGTAVGIVVGSGIVYLLGTDPVRLWVVLPVCIVLAGLAPAVISFTAGQAGFTITLVILFNIISPAGYTVGLIRIEDIAIGCAVSLLVGLLFWPRGASAALGQALAEAYRTGAEYLRSSVAWGIACCHGGASGRPAPAPEATAAAAASRRLDDAFREYLNERGGKQLRLGEVGTLLTGTIAPRLAGDAIRELWSGESAQAQGERTAAGTELSTASARLLHWYEQFGAALTGSGALPEPTDRDHRADQRLIAAVRRDLADDQGLGTPTAVRMIWTGDHLDAIRRLQSSLTGPAEVIRAGRGPRHATDPDDLDHRPTAGQPVAAWGSSRARVSGTPGR